MELAKSLAKKLFVKITEMSTAGSISGGTAATITTPQTLSSSSTSSVAAPNTSPTATQSAQNKVQADFGTPSSNKLKDIPGIKDYLPINNTDWEADIDAPAIVIHPGNPFFKLNVLVWAVTAGDYTLITMLLNNNANPNTGIHIRNESTGCYNHFTPLGASISNEKVTEKLLKSGAIVEPGILDYNFSSKKGHTSEFNPDARASSYGNRHLLRAIYKKFVSIEPLMQQLQKNSSLNNIRHVFQLIAEYARAFDMVNFSPYLSQREKHIQNLFIGYCERAIASLAEEERIKGLVSKLSRFSDAEIDDMVKKADVEKARKTMTMMPMYSATLTASGGSAGSPALVTSIVMTPDVGPKKVGIKIEELDPNSPDTTTVINTPTSPKNK